mmetsp:Transcript_65936/g.110007  ORF Transcript_65936/g.110007 Transcript_65936/m.110007 type:complete len:201 (+) Transcript_65936:3262-3864(+)
MFLIQLLACPWGSIKRGQRRDVVEMMAFSVEKASEGSPCSCHCWMVTGSPMNVTKSNVSDPGIRFSWHSLTQPCTNSERYSDVKGPRYAIKPDATTTSPKILSYWRPSCSLEAVYLVFSPPSPSMSFSARSSFFSVISNSSCRFCFFSMFSASVLLRSASRSSMSFNIAFLAFRSDIAAANSASASASIAFFGFTTLLTL